jgi:hypothetical protein
VDHVAHAGNEKFWLVSLKEEDDSEGLGLDGSIPLK